METKQPMKINLSNIKLFPLFSRDEKDFSKNVISIQYLNSMFFLKKTKNRLNKIALLVSKNLYYVCKLGPILSKSYIVKQ